MAKKQKTAVVLHVQPKTARVRVDRMLRHPVYEKDYRSSKSLLAHLQDSMQVHPGDTVTIEEIRPVSKRKAWTVVHVVTPAKIADTLKIVQAESDTAEAETLPSDGESQ